jgi:hypothetical protein
MRRLLWIAAFGLLLVGSHGFSQTTNKAEWGPWRYTNFKVSAIEFRSKCISSSDGDSRWAYQFRSHYDAPGDFAERVEHGHANSRKNDFDKRWRLTLDGGKMSPVFETQLHSTCAEIQELRIEVSCATTVLGLEGPCYQEPDGSQVQPMPVPDNPQ